MANTAPIFTVTPDISWGSTDGNGGAAGPLKTANTALDGTGTVLTVFTAGAAGSYLLFLFAKAAGTNVSSVLRVFINNSGSNATAANNIFFDELALPNTTASSNSATQTLRLGLRLALPASYKVNVAIGTTVAAGWFVGVAGGDY